MNAVNQVLLDLRFQCTSLQYVKNDVVPAVWYSIFISLSYGIGLRRMAAMTGPRKL